MTGRKGRIVQHADGQIGYESRSESDVPLEILNISERERFMRGEKFVAIISEAASSGISLQADRRCQNTRRRVHVTLELPWSADRAVQQFGKIFFMELSIRRRCCVFRTNSSIKSSIRSRICFCHLRISWRETLCFNVRIQ